MRILVIIVRVFVLLGALGAAGYSAFSGFVAYGLAKEVADKGVESTEVRIDLSTGKEKEPPTLHEREVMVKSMLLFFAGSALALFGGLLAIFGFPGNGGLWLLAGGAGPAVLNPALLCGSFPLLAVAGLSLLAWFLSLFVKPKTEAAAA
jgi:hypothetical protein